MWRLREGLAALALAAASAFAAVPQAHAAGTASLCGSPAKITLDIGHSPGKAGATSATGKPEYAFNKRFVSELAAALDHSGGFEVTVLNPSGRDLSLGQRGAEIAGIGQGIFVSIHHDSVQPRYLSTWLVNGQTRHYSDLFRGFSLFVSHRSAMPQESIALGRALGSQLLAAGFRPSLHHGEAIEGENRPVIDASRGVFAYDGLAVLRNARIPAVLLEVGVILNRAEEAALETPDVRARIAAAVVAGLRSFCQL